MTAGTPTGTVCPACASAVTATFFTEAAVPTNSCLLLDTPDEADGYPRGSIDLRFCDTCGFVFNGAFVPGQPEYSQRYEETQGFSAHFMAFAQDLARRWVERYGLADKTAIEIGCGKGEFLLELKKAGAGHCIGIDPGVHPERIGQASPQRQGLVCAFRDTPLPVIRHYPDVACHLRLHQSKPRSARMSANFSATSGTDPSSISACPASVGLAMALTWTAAVVGPLVAAIVSISPEVMAARTLAMGT